MMSVSKVSRLYIHFECINLRTAGTLYCLTISDCFAANISELFHIRSHHEAISTAANKTPPKFLFMLHPGREMFQHSPSARAVTTTSNKCTHSSAHIIIAHRC